MNDKKNAPINAANVIKRAADMLTRPREPSKSASEAMKNIKVSKDDPLVKPFTNPR
ncbi:MULTISPECIES: hypothetical protein [Cohnella]|uniref:hypothetical protein n=1 Tax=Cohnella TaxID=329857 RepID=UPI001593AD07|nr:MULTISPECIES: hypothetical protein [Cohnella]MBN2980391.1 hypothetical protein [Cohnella algarum]